MMSSFSNDSLLNPYFLTADPYSCFMTSPGRFIFSTFKVVYIIILLPLCILIFSFGFQQLRQKSHASSATSHSDSFTYHVVSMELIGVLGCVVSFCGSYTANPKAFTTGVNIFSFTWYGQIYFHILTCVERYLAVVHPVTYMSLRSERGVRIRHATIGCIWLLCFTGCSVVTTGSYIYLDAFLLILSTTIISFCSLSVLSVLIRPGPGERGEGGGRVDPSKLRAFYIIVTILGILMLRLFFGLVWAGLELSRDGNQCLMMACGVWVNLPSSLVLPLLFLLRTRK